MSIARVLRWKWRCDPPIIIPIHRGSRSTGIDRDGAVCVVLFFQPWSWRSQQSTQEKVSHSPHLCQRARMLRILRLPDRAPCAPCVTATTAAMSKFLTLRLNESFGNQTSPICSYHMTMVTIFFFRLNNIPSAAKHRDDVLPIRSMQIG